MNLVGTLNPGSLTVNNPTKNYTFSGTGGLTNSGTGQLVLTGSNSYTGATAVHAGTLLVNGNSLACTNMVTVAGGATLGGTGTNGGNVILNAGGQLAPGLTNNIGTLVLTNNLTLNGSYLLFNLAGVANDRVAVGNNLTANGTNPVILTYAGMYGKDMSTGRGISPREIGRITFLAPIMEMTTW